MIQIELTEQQYEDLLLAIERGCEYCTHMIAMGDQYDTGYEDERDAFEALDRVIRAVDQNSLAGRMGRE